MPFEKPKYDAPAGPPVGGWTLDALKRHLQTAVLLELYTIPLYLFAAYSFKSDSKSQAAKGKIMGIVKQEMLHLALSGNILCSIGGTPLLYGELYTPEFPRQIFFDEVDLNLKPATKDTIKTFMRVEEPKPLAVPDAWGPPVLGTYDTIGEFYREIEIGIKEVDKTMTTTGRKLFLAETVPKQFNSSDKSWDDDDMKIVTNLKEAESALDIIITQGEGALAETDECHYHIFKELSENYSYQTYDVVEDPQPAKYRDEKFYGLMVACDAAYSYLLMTIEKLWQYDGDQRGDLITTNITDLMKSVIGPLAGFLVTQPIENVEEDRGKNAAPPFRRYDFSDDTSAFIQLKQLVADGVKKYDSGRLRTVNDVVEGLIDLSELKQ